MTRRRLAKYFAFLRIAYAQARMERTELYGRMLFIVVVVYVFSALWQSVSAAGMLSGAAPRDLVWYLAATEWIVMSVPPVHFHIADEVRRGDVAYRLSRPVSYLGSLFAGSLGELLARSPLLALSACGAAFVFGGGLPETPRALLHVVPFGLAAAVVGIAFNMVIGLTAFWFHDVMPLHWVWQKLCFVLGGLMLPLELCPTALQRVASFTPFPSLLYGPASFLLGTSVHRAESLSIDLGAWFVLAVLVAAASFRRVRVTLQLNGG